MRIVAVDDEKPSLTALTAAIEAAVPGCELRPFQWASELLKCLEDGFQPDVAFMDIEMPELTGLELAKRIKDISRETLVVFVTGYSQYAIDAYKLHAKGYLQKPVTAQKVVEELNELKLFHAGREARIKVRCFGNFEVFVDDTPLWFKHGKTKELLAFLIDRHGASLTTAELCSVLWEGQLAGDNSNFRHLASDLVKTLHEADAENILVRRRNSYAIDPNSFSCDMYNFLERDIDAINAYRGEYMSQYSWAEMTLGSLEN